MWLFLFCAVACAVVAILVGVMLQRRAGHQAAVWFARVLALAAILLGLWNTFRQS